MSLLNYGSRLVEGIFLVGRTYRVIGSSPVRRSTSRGYLVCRKCDWYIEPEEVHMRKVVAAEFLSLDGVMESIGLGGAGILMGACRLAKGPSV